MSAYEEVTAQIEDCEKRESKLSDWERQFIDSVSLQRSKGKSLTRKQLQTLDDIWERIT